MEKFKNYRFLKKKRLLCTIMKTFIFLMCTTMFGFTNKNLFAKKIVVEKNQAITVGQQQHQIKGVIKDQKGMPIPGANVQVKGTSNVAQTDFDGCFSIKTDKENVTLIVSFIGFNTKEIVVNSQNVVNIILEESSTGLNEIVVMGYGSFKVKDLTGSVGRADINSMAKAPVISIQDALTGRVAGVSVVSSDGQPGAQANIVIRGANSITGSNNPLYVVDGFPMESFNLNSLNQADIKSIDVLKDASATAIYGARGANGVIMITTKGGEVGVPIINFTTSVGSLENIKTKELMSSYEFVKYQIDFNPTTTSTTGTTPTEIYLTKPGLTLEDYKNAKTNDWQAAAFRAGLYKKYGLSLSGGTKDTKYFVSGSIDDAEGTIINSGNSRYSGRIKLDQNINEKLTVGVNLNYSQLKAYGLQVGLPTNSGSTNLFYSVWGYNPLNVVVTDPNYEEPDPLVNPANDYRSNPIVALNSQTNITKTSEIIANTYLNYKITPQLVLRITGGLTGNTSDNEFLYRVPKSSSAIILNSRGDYGKVSTTKNNTWINENTLTYTAKYRKNNFKFLGGFTQSGNNSSQFGYGASFLPNPDLGVSGLDQGTLAPGDTRALKSSWTSVSALGRFNYYYDGKYYVTLSYRADGSSKFSPENKWAYFPSGALAWRFSKEKIVSDIKWLSEGKLRTSYGETGNNRVSDFAYLGNTSITTSQSYAFNNTNVAGLFPTVLSNTNLKWETTKQYDAGMDLSFFSNKYNLSVDVYLKETSNLLLNARLPASAGYATALKNIGSTENKGLEITLNTENIRTKNFSWTTNFNIAFNQNKVTALAEGQTSITDALNWDNNWSGTPGYISAIGRPMGLMYGFIQDGLYQYSDFDVVSDGSYILKSNVPTNGNTRNGIRPGDIKYRDINGDGIVNASDYTVIGRSAPIHEGGFGNDFAYKGFSLNVFFQWKYGNDIQNANNIMFDGNSLAKPNLNQFASYIDRWSPTNQDTSKPRANGFRGGGYSTYTIEDGSFIRLKTIALSYNLPKEVLDLINLTSFQLTLSAQNLITWTKYSGLDPEVSTYNSPRTAGFDYSLYPRARTIALGLNINF